MSEDVNSVQIDSVFIKWKCESIESPFSGCGKEILTNSNAIFLRTYKKDLTSILDVKKLLQKCNELSNGGQFPVDCQEVLVKALQHFATPSGIGLDKIREVVAQSWCLPRNSQKIFDPELAEDISLAIHQAMPGVATNPGEGEVLVYCEDCFKNKCSEILKRNAWKIEIYKRPIQ